MKRHFVIISASLLVVSRSLNSLFKVLFNFRSHYLFAIGLAVIFSLRRCIPPTSSCTLKQPYSQTKAFVLVHYWNLEYSYGTLTLYGQLLDRSFEYMPVNTLNSSI